MTEFEQQLLDGVRGIEADVQTIIELMASNETQYLMHPYTAAVLVGLSGFAIIVGLSYIYRKSENVGSYELGQK